MTSPVAGPARHRCNPCAFRRVDFVRAREEYMYILYVYTTKISVVQPFFILFSSGSPLFKIANVNAAMGKFLTNVVYLQPARRRHVLASNPIAYNLHH